ncbi:PASTA domain-containing protein [Psychroflexus sp. CAK8W]|uniref:PASTA domain-containing protein n=1 Tax=Psychroflexus longus TaxID=2873596 RepID=A0ABS7XH97_9FLAO|nr:PASTA domain-containing protein [Psychroflexus longus]MBZ9778332.1 PASTA domain-containing protein [Psychroflexus longus]
MKFFKFIFSKAFLLQLIIAAVVTVVMVFGTLKYLDIKTDHNETVEVPDLSKFELDIVDKKLEEMNLRREVLDSANYNPNYPPYSVLDQVPKPGKQVKENRKIYLTLNPSGFIDVEIPQGLIRQTRRQVEPTLIALGFQIGDVIMKPDIAKGAILELRHKGETIKAGDKLPKTSTIDLVVGDGSL